MDFCAARSREATTFRTQCILSITSPPTATATSTVLEFEKLQLSPLEAIPNAVPANRSWTTSKSTAKTAVLDLEKIPTLDTHPIPFVSDKSLTYGGAVGSPSEVGYSLFMHMYLSSIVTRTCVERKESFQQIILNFCGWEHAEFNFMFYTK